MDLVAGDTDNVATILYEGMRRNGDPFALALDVDRAGGIDPSCLHLLVDLGQAPIWRIGRRTRSDAGSEARVQATLEDTPFYARSLVASRLAGRDMLSVHESLSVDRFAQPIVQMMLPFRMPRRR